MTCTRARARNPFCSPSHAPRALRTRQELALLIDFAADIFFTLISSCMLAQVQLLSVGLTVCLSVERAMTGERERELERERGRREIRGGREREKEGRREREGGRKGVVGGKSLGVLCVSIRARLRVFLRVCVCMSVQVNFELNACISLFLSLSLARALSPLSLSLSVHTHAHTCAGQLGAEVTAPTGQLGKAGQMPGSSVWHMCACACANAI